jgi:glycerol dehydrogenase-like iron-containing ADH family enzyme
LSALGVTARGHVSSHDPLQAADEGLREIAADELVFVTLGAGEAADVVDTARRRYGIPVRQIAVPPTTRSADG